MTRAIRWEPDWDIALASARVQEKCLLVDFFNPGCGACKQMEAVTYPDPRTVDFISEHMIAHRVDVASRGALAMTYHIQYTPTIITLDSEGFECHRTVGFLPPLEFVPSLMLGVARAEFNARRFKRCLGLIQRILANYPHSKCVPEARAMEAACQAHGV